LERREGGQKKKKPLKVEKKSRRVVKKHRGVRAKAEGR